MERPSAAVIAWVLRATGLVLGIGGVRVGYALCTLPGGMETVGAAIMGMYWIAWSVTGLLILFTSLLARSTSAPGTGVALICAGWQGVGCLVGVPVWLQV